MFLEDTEPLVKPSPASSLACFQAKTDCICELTAIFLLLGSPLSGNCVTVMTKMTNTDLEWDRGFSNPHSQAWTMAWKEGFMEKEADVQADARGGDKI